MPLITTLDTSWSGPPRKDCRTEETDTSSLEADRNQEMFGATPKKPEFKLRQDGSLGPKSTIIWSAGFPLESLFLAQTTHLSVY